MAGGNRRIQDVAECTVSESVWFNRRGVLFSYEVANLWFLDKTKIFEWGKDNLSDYYGPAGG